MKKHWQEKNMKLHYSRLQLHISHSFCSGTPTIRQRIIQYLGLITHIYLMFSLFCCAVYIMIRLTFVIALLLI